MKKITLLLLFFCTFMGYAQLETFESGIPSSWKVLTGVNGLGAGEVWKTSAAPNSNYPAFQGDQAAYVNNANIGENNTEEDWLIMNQRTVPANGQLRFFVRQTIEGNQTTFMEIRVSTNPTQDNQAAYTTLDVLDEAELNDLNGPITAYREQVINLNDYIGQTVYIAFVRVYKQLTPARAGDRFLIDNVNVLSECIVPSVAAAPFATVFSTAATLTWQHSGGNSFELENVQENQNFTGLGTTIVNITPPTPYSYIKTGLLPSTTYKFRVRTRCTDPQGNIYTSEWSNTAIYTTLPLGSVCNDPLVVSALPYQVSGANTGTYGDEYDGLQGPSCGATPATTNYLGGAEVFYSYTAAQSGNISVTLTPLGATSTNSSVFVYTGSCTSITSGCIAGLANTNTNIRVLNLAVTAGQTYYIVVSSAAATQTINYNLLIQQENCLPKPDTLSATGASINGATLGWGNPGGYSSFQVEVQLVNSPIPSGAGSDVINNVSGPTISFLKTDLEPATIYQFWVRAECTPGSNVWTSWEGPFVFNTMVCTPAEACNYTFRLTDTGNNGWGNNRMQVRQNGIVVATLGTQIATGSGPIDVVVPICPNVPFDLFWSVTGTGPGQCGVSILNSFNQTLYTKPANLSAVGTVLFSGVGKCNVPECNLMPTGLSAIGITTEGAILNWTAVATSAWEIYIVPSGSPAPSNLQGPLTPPPGGFYYTGTDGGPDSFTFIIPDALLADTAYDFYVRTPCTPNPSPWSGSVTFTTLPTCYKPTNLNVGSITKSSASLSWDNGQAGDNSWEILLIPGPNQPAAPPVNPVLTGGTLLFPTTNASPFDPGVGSLTPATIYWYYIRTVCPGDDKSTWAGPFKFNTVTCDDIDKCNYKFVLTNPTGNTWSGARMQIRQNGILITTIGASSINNANGVSVGLCPGVPFELFWSVPGTAPENVGVSIQNPFLDVIFTKFPGTGSPLTEVYNGVTNCTPASCSKPTNILVTNITANTATITWTDNSTPVSTAYDLYVVPTGQPAPINFPATNPTVSGITLSGPGNTYVLSTINGSDPLLPSTSYTFYVRAVCGPGETSTWTILTPVTFVTRPLNDECATATAVTINDSQLCAVANLAHGHTYGGSASLPAANSGTGCGTTDDDIWFSFVALHTSQTITFMNIVATPATAKINHSVFSGTCGNLTQLYCNANNSSIITGLTVGETYFIRVYTAGSNLAQHVKFDMCITSPPINDECANAIMIPTHPTRVCTTPTAVNTLGATTSLPVATPGAACGTVNDDMWYSFVATSTIHIITISNVVGGTTDINHSLYSGTDCSNLTQLYCSNPDKSVATNLVVGNTYKIRVYTAGSNTSQSATFDLCITTPPPVANDNCEDAILAFNNYGLECEQTTPVSLTGATPSPQPSTCAGAEDDDVWFKFIANSTSQQVTFDNIEGTTTALNYSLYKGDTCDAMAFIVCGTGDEFVLSNLIIGDEYKLRIWTTSATVEDCFFDLCIIRLPPPIYTSSTLYYPTNVAFGVPDLVDDILIDADSQCAEATNVTWKTGTAQGFNGIGYFHKRFSDFPIEEGVVLSTGNATSAGGSNSSLLGQGVNAWAGDNDIEAVVLAATGNEMESYNATILEFDFVPSIDFITFPFIFASEEYGQFQCDYSDSFAFLLTNTITGVTTNLALVPGTSDPVSVVTIRNELYNEGDICESVNPGFFDKYYDNDIGTNILAAPVNFNGITIKMDAVANVVPNTPYHIKMVIADRLDSNYDSAIFIGKFTIGAPPKLGDDLLLANGNPVCDGEPIVLNSNIANPGLFEIEWLNGSGIIPNENGPTLTVSTSGTYTVNAKKIGLTCVQSDSIVVEYYDDLTAVTPPNLIKCDASGAAEFDLTDNAAAILAPFTDPHTLTYFTNPLSAENNVEADAIPTADLDSFPGVDQQMIYVRVEHDEYGCDQVVNFKLIVQDLTPQFQLTGNMNVCPAGQTTISVQPINNNFNIADPNVTYKWFNEGTEIVGQTGPTLNLPVTSPAAIPLFGNYSVVVNNSGCSVDPPVGFTITQNTIPWDIVATQVPASLCPTQPATVSFAVSNSPVGETISYTLTNPALETQTNQTGTFNIVGPGLYTVDVDILGCTTPYQFTIAPSVSNWTVTFGGPYTICGNETVNLSFTGINFNVNDPNATYKWTSPNGTEFTGPILTGANELGNYILNIDIYGCSNTQTVNVGPGTSNWDVTFAGPYVICPGQPVDLSFTPVNFNINDAVFNWTSPSGVQSAGAVLNDANEVGQYTLNVSIDGCNNDLFVTVTENTNVISIDLESGCEGQKFIVRALPLNNSFDPLTSDYEWSGTGFTTTADDNTVVITSKGVVTVKVTTDQGCFGTEVFDSTNINLGCVIQKGISPNNNGENDTFDLSGYNVAKLTIFNRYGTEVYQRNNYVNEWGGQSNSGDELTDGVYFYVIDLVEGGTKNGWIYINR